MCLKLMLRDHPSRIIRALNPYPKPKGIYWELLNQEKNKKHSDTSMVIWQKRPVIYQTIEILRYLSKYQSRRSLMDSASNVTYLTKNH